MHRIEENEARECLLVLRDGEVECEEEEEGHERQRVDEPGSWGSERSRVGDGGERWEDGWRQSEGGC
jgi:hypothetical protein